MFHHNEDVLGVLKYIQQSDDIRMLTNLQDFNLSFIKLKIFWVHLLLLEDFYCYFGTSFFVGPGLYSAKFAFPNRLSNIIIVKNVMVPYSLLYL